MKRLTYFDGLRGLASLVVVFSHYVLAFAPGLYSEFQDLDHGLERRFAFSPLSIAWNGRFAVALFFVLSAYILASSGLKNPSARWALVSAFKRYPRLAIPALASVLLAWWMGLMSQGYYYWEIYEIAHAVEPNRYRDVGFFLSAVHQGLIGAFFEGKYSLNPVLWTISIEFFGSMLVFALLWIVPDRRRRMVACAGIVLLYVWSSWYAAFALGILAADMAASRKHSFKIWIALFLAIMGGYLGTYPYVDNKGFWRHLPVIFEHPQVFYAMAGAFVVVVSISGSQLLQKILGVRPLAYLGDISFAMYLVHFPIIFVCAPYAIYLAHENGFSYGQAFFVAIAPTLVLIVACADVFMRLVDRPAIEISRLVGQAVGRRLDMISNRDGQSKTSVFQGFSFPEARKNNPE